MILVRIGQIKTNMNETLEEEEKVIGNNKVQRNYSRKKSYMKLTKELHQISTSSVESAVPSKEKKQHS